MKPQIEEMVFQAKLMGGIEELARVVLGPWNGKFLYAYYEDWNKWGLRKLQKEVKFVRIG